MWHIYFMSGVLKTLMLLYSLNSKFKAIYKKKNKKIKLSEQIQMYSMC